MIIFGIDPGSERTGFGCVQSDGHRHRLVRCGAIQVEAGAAFPDRLGTIFRSLVAELEAFGGPLDLTDLPSAAR